jgi:hypothetical protein
MQRARLSDDLSLAYGAGSYEAPDDARQCIWRYMSWKVRCSMSCCCGFVAGG